MNKKFSLSKEERAEKTKYMIKTLERGVDKIFDSNSYKDYLRTIRKFHSYSFRNSMLIILQNPNATRVAGFNTWKSMGRNVKKGENGIKILAPCPFKVKEKNENGDTVEKTIPYFKVVSVFDVSQTEGNELPSIEVERIKGDDCDYFDGVMESLKLVSPFPIEFIDDGENDKDVLGWCDYSKKLIAIKNSLSHEETIKVSVHEIAHAFTEGHKFTRNKAEIVAESVAFIVSDFIGVDSSRYSFGYIVGWSNADRKLFYKMLDTIQKVSDDILAKLEKYLTKEHSRELEPVCV